MIVVTGFLSILNQMDFHLVQNRKENCHHDQIPLNLKEGNGNIVFAVYIPAREDYERELFAERNIVKRATTEHNNQTRATKYSEAVPRRHLSETFRNMPDLPASVFFLS